MVAERGVREDEVTRRIDAILELAGDRHVAVEAELVVKVEAEGHPRDRERREDRRQDVHPRTGSPLFASIQGPSTAEDRLRRGCGDERAVGQAAASRASRARTCMASIQATSARPKASTARTARSPAEITCGAAARPRSHTPGSATSSSMNAREKGTSTAMGEGPYTRSAGDPAALGDDAGRLRHDIRGSVEEPGRALGQGAKGTMAESLPPSHERPARGDRRVGRLAHARALPGRRADRLCRILRRLPARVGTTTSTLKPSSVSR